MKLRPFELALIAIFGVLFFVALILLRTYTPDPKAEDIVGNVSIWGVLPAATFAEVIKELEITDKSFERVSYRYVNPDNFDEAFVTALADGTAPDLLLIGHDRIIEQRKRLQTISYETLPIRDFRNSYIDGAEIFALSDGIYALPVAVDPLVMYWNRDIFATKNLLTAPKTWEELVAEVIPTLTVRDAGRNITRPAIALGEYSNIRNSFPILSLLLLQGGSALITESQNLYKVRLNESVDQVNSNPFTKAITFYTNFNNTANTLYSWNRSFKEDREMFLSEELAIYFGFASEGKEIESKNPNLSFDIAYVPQGAAATVSRTFGAYYGLTIPKAAKNKLGALTILQKLSNQQVTEKIATGYGMAPVFRSSLVSGSNDVYGRIAYGSALNSRGWLNPDLDQFGNIFKELLESVSANRSNLSTATADAITKIEQIY
jgi:ABC-type glycerol-3-phosphate transport system substrate-binding protein